VSVGRASALVLLALAALTDGGGAAHAGGDVSTPRLACVLAVAPEVARAGDTLTLSVTVENRGEAPAEVFLRDFEVEAALAAKAEDGAALRRVPVRERMIAEATAADIATLAPGGRQVLALSGTLREAPAHLGPGVLIDLGGSTAFLAHPKTTVTFSLVYHPAAWLPSALTERVPPGTVACTPARLRLTG